MVKKNYLQSKSYSHKKLYNVAVIGATGNVGREVLGILAERNFPINQIYALASADSSGKIVSYGLQKQLNVEDLATFDIKKANLDIAFFCAGSQVSKNFIKKFTNNNVVVIDKSSLYRMDDDVPLIIPEVNRHEIKKYKKRHIIATPNCTVTPMLVALKPLHDLFTIKRIIVTTYQSVSGTGKAAMDELFFQTKQFYEAAITEIEKPEGKIYPKRIAFNCIPQCDAFTGKDGYTKEEMKIINETNKILNKKINITATCVRVPVFVCHAESINVEFEKPFQINQIYDALEEAEGVVILDRKQDGGYATQYEFAGTDSVYVSRIRVDNSNTNTLNFWCVCDNIRKGAALNGIQIAEELIKVL
jgi:aspartate-semialdehyde dehydrogenase